MCDVAISRRDDEPRTRQAQAIAAAENLIEAVGRDALATELNAGQA
jgi:hypothetical protein